MTSLAWNPDGGSYAVATLKQPGDVLVTADAFGTGAYAFTSSWLAEDGSNSGSPLVNQSGGQVQIIQGEDTQTGLLVVIAFSDGIASNGITLMVVAEGYGSSASYGSAYGSPISNNPLFYWRDSPFSPQREATLAGNGTILAIAETRFNAADDWFTYSEWLPEVEGTPGPSVDIYGPQDIRIEEAQFTGKGVFTIGAMITDQPNTRTELILIIGAAIPPEYRLYWPLSANLGTPNIAYEFTFYSNSGEAGIEIDPVYIAGAYNYCISYSPVTHYRTTREDTPVIPFYSVIAQSDGETITESNALDHSAWDDNQLGIAAGPALPIYDPDTPPAEAVLPSSSTSLSLSANGLLSHYAALAANAIPLQGQLALRFSSVGKLVTRKLLKVVSALHVSLFHASAQAPTGLQSQLREEINPAQPDDPIEYLQVWFYGHPQDCIITARIDDGPAFTPAFTWQNPGTIAPAILKIPISGLPGDGSTHVITISVSQKVNGQTSPAATISVKAKLPHPKPPPPVSIHARLIRQATQEIPDLVEVTWTASSGVVISANLRPQGWNPGEDPTKLAGKTIRLGYGNESESRMQFEGIGARFEFATGSEQQVYFSVAAIRNNEVSPPLFTINPLRIRAFKSEIIPPKTPDEIAGTARQMGNSSLRIEGAQAGTSDYDATIAGVAYDKLLLRIKEIISEGGSVTLDNLGRFEARWSEAKPVKGPAGTSYTKPGERSVAFVPSIGFKEGTERGRIMTDAEAKALLP